MKKADALLILQRAERRDRLEVTMKRRYAQRCHFSERLNPDCLGKILTNPVDRDADTRERRVGRGDVS